MLLIPWAPWTFASCAAYFGQNLIPLLRPTCRQSAQIKQFCSLAMRQASA
jgi:hypothetical protein